MLICIFVGEGCANQHPERPPRLGAKKKKKRKKKKNNTKLLMPLNNTNHNNDNKGLAICIALSSCYVELETSRCLQSAHSHAVVIQQTHSQVTLFEIVMILIDLCDSDDLMIVVDH